MGALNSENERAERLAQLGAQLRQVRKENALTLEHVAAKTMIQARQLKAMEEGNLRDLPEPVYIQGLLKRYADALGLNGAEFARTFPTASIDLPVITEPAKAPIPPRLRPIHLYLLYIAVIAAAVGGLSLMFNRGSNSGVVATPSPSPSVSPVAISPSPSTSPTPSPTPVAVSPSPSPVASPVVSPSPSPVAVSPSPSLTPTVTLSPAPVVSPSPVTSVTPPALSGQVRAGVTLRQASWIEVRVDGKVVYEGILPAGTKQTWTAKSKLELSAGNAGGVMVSVNNAPPKPLGQPGAVETATYLAAAAPVTTPQ